MDALDQAMVLVLPVGGPAADEVMRSTEARVTAAGGVFDGWERNPSETTIFCYGTNADDLFAAIAPLIDGWKLPKGAVAQLFHGPADDPGTPVFHVSLEAGKKRTKRRPPRPRRAKRYEIGDWFAQPIADHGCVVGRVVAARGPQMIAYYFAPLRPTIPEMAELARLEPEDAFTYVHSADFSLREAGNAIIIGGRDDLDDRSWPVPQFVFTDHLGQPWAVQYDRSVHLQPRTRLSRSSAKGEPEATVLGSPEIKLIVTMVERGLLPDSARAWINDIPTRSAHGM